MRGWCGDVTAWWFAARCALFLALAIMTAGIGWWLESPVAAQEKAENAEAQAPPDAPLEEVKEAPQGEPAAAAEPPTNGAPANGAAPAPSAADTPPAQKSQLRWLYDALGLRYTVAFLAISFSLVALVVLNLLAVRRESVVPLALVEGFEAQLKEKRYQEAYELAKADDSFLGRVLTAGLSKVSQQGYEPAIEAMQEVGEEENMRMEHRLSYLALIGTISPMVGLLGTVDGMIMSFNVIAASTTQPKPAQLAAGISTALVTTLVGLLLAIPTIAIHNILANRVGRLVLEVGTVSEQLMSRFSGTSAKKA